MLLIHTALPFEAKPLIKGLGLAQTGSPGGGRLYRDTGNRYLLLISGIGKEKTEKTIQSLILSLRSRNLSITKALNIGLAGDPARRFVIGKALNITSVSCEGINKPPFSLPILLNHLESSELCTVDTPCSDPTVFAENKPPLLLDMEVWHLVDTLFRNNLPMDAVHAIKIVSDFADGTPLDPRKLAGTYDATIESLLQTIANLHF
jgi:hypothetical protein